MALVSDLLKLLREADASLTVPELARLTGSTRELVEAALDELARRGKLERVAADCGQESCPLADKCGGCAYCSVPKAGLKCPVAWRLTGTERAG